MTNAIIIHGCFDKKEEKDPNTPSASNNHWLPWLQTQLIAREIDTQTPEMPDPFNPDYAKWKDLLERIDINEDTILIGHSCGAGFLLRWLTETDKKVKYVVLVAPWLDYKKIHDDFLQFTLNNSIVKKAEKIDVVYSKDDPKKVVHKAVKEVRKIIPENIHELNGMGHFTMNDMKTEKFEFLLELILKNIK